LPGWITDPFFFGAVCGLSSSVAYTGANICLRAVAHCDPTWVSCVKSAPTILLFTPWFLILAQRKQRILPPMKALWALALAGLVGQLFGNVLFQWSLGVLGIALTVPLVLGTMIAGGAVLGQTVLGERVTVRALLSLVVLVIAIIVLSLGAGNAYQSVTGLAPADAGGWLILAAGVGAAMISGLAYAQLGVVIRYATSSTPLCTTVVVVAISGLLALGLLSLNQVGVAGMLQTTSTDLAMMLLAGVCNAMAFISLAKALQLTPVVYVNAINATQATMGMLAGVFIFHEATSPALLLGVGLTIVGLLLTDRKKPKPNNKPKPPTPIEAEERTSPMLETNNKAPERLPSP